jgi:hypothetical protein
MNRVGPGRLQLACRRRGTLSVLRWAVMTDANRVGCTGRRPSSLDRAQILEGACWRWWHAVPAAAMPSRAVRCQPAAAATQQIVARERRP